jgi:hypothetical protein
LESNGPYKKKNKAVLLAKLQIESLMSSLESGCEDSFGANDPEEEVGEEVGEEVAAIVQGRPEKRVRFESAVSSEDSSRIISGDNDDNENCSEDNDLIDDDSNSLASSLNVTVKDDEDGPNQLKVNPSLFTSCNNLDNKAHERNCSTVESMTIIDLFRYFEEI